MVNTKLMKERRESLNLSQEGIAENAGISLSQYQNFESGKDDLSKNLNIALVLAFILQVEVEELIPAVDIRDKPTRNKNITFDGRKLWDERLKKGISRAELGDFIGVNKKTIDNWEHGLMCPCDENRDLLEKFFSVKEGYFTLP